MKHKGWLVLILILCAWLIPTAAGAQIQLGTRSYAAYDEIVLQSESSVAETLDWLQGFRDSQVGYARQLSTSLAHLVTILQEAGETVSPEDEQLVKDCVLNSSELYADVSLCYDRLVNAYGTVENLYGDIRSGDYGEQDQLEMKSRAVETMNGSLGYRTAALNNADHWQQTAAELIAQMGGSLDASTRAAYVSTARAAESETLAQRLYARAEVVLSRQAEEIAAQEDDPHVLTVVSTEQLCLIVQDSDGNPLAHISVTISDGITDILRYTNAEGKALFLASALRPSQTLPEYWDVTLTVDGTKYGYQLREFGKLSMQGGDTRYVTLREDDGKTPYLIRATYDGKDMLDIADGFYVTEQNNKDHTVSLRAKLNGKENVIRVKMYQPSEASKKLADGTLVPAMPENVMLDIQIINEEALDVTRKWANPRQAGSVQGDRSVYFETKPDSGWIFDVAPTMSAWGFPVGDVANIPSQKQGSIEQLFQGKSGVSLGNQFPILGNISYQYPFAHSVDFYFEIFGPSLHVSYNFNGVYPSYKSMAKSWDTQTMEESKAMHKAIRSCESGILNKYVAGLTEDERAFHEGQVLGSTKIAFVPFVTADLSYNTKTEKLTGMVVLGATVSFTVDYTWPYMAGPVPLYVSVDFGLSVTVAGQVGASLALAGDSIGSIELADGSGFAIMAHLSVGASCGIGNPKLISAGLHIGFWVDATFMVAKNANPPLRVEIGASLDINFLFFGFHWSQSIFKISYVLAWHGDVLETKTTAETKAIPAALAGMRDADADLVMLSGQAGAIGSMRVIDAGNGNTYAFWIEKAQGGSHLRYLRLDGSSEAKDFVASELDAYVYSFAIEYGKANGCFYLVVHSGPNPVARQKEGVTAAQQLTAYYEQSKGSKLTVYSFPTPDSAPGFTLVNAMSLAENEVPYACQIMPYSAPVYVYAQNGNYYYTDFAIAAMTLTPTGTDGDGQPVYRFGFHTSFPQVTRETATATWLGETYNCTASYTSDAYAVPVFELTDLCASPRGSDRRRPMISVLAPKLGETGAELVITDDNNLTTLLPGERFTGMVLIPSRDYLSETEAFLLMRQVDGEVTEDAKTSKMMVLFIPAQNPDVYSDDYDTKIIKRYMTARDMDVEVPATAADVVSVNPVSNGDQYYAYWLQCVDGDQHTDADGRVSYDKKYVLRASLLDMNAKLATPDFVWTELGNSAEHLTLMPITDINQPMFAYYGSAQPDGTYQLYQKRLTLKVGVKVDAFSADSPTIKQGEAFGMSFRLENTGNFVVDSFDVNVYADRNDESGEDHQVITFHVDAASAAQNSLTLYAGQNGEALGTLAGEAAVTRTADLQDQYSNETPQVSDYSVTENGSVSASSTVETIGGLMPGCVRTYKTTAAVYPTTWSGEYTLRAQVDKVYFSATLGGSPQQAHSASQATQFVAQRDGNGEMKIFADGSQSRNTLLAGSVPDIIEYDSSTALKQPQQYSGNLTYHEVNDEAQSGDQRYMNIAYNDVELYAHLVRRDGEQYVLINLSNDTHPLAPQFVPKIIFSVEGATTYTCTLNTDLKGGFNRSLLIPLREAAGGKAFEKLDVRVESAAEEEAYVVDLAKDSETLTPLAAFFFTLQPEDQTVFEGEDAVFYVAVGGEGSPFRYQWQMRYPDGSWQNIPGATTDKLIIPNARLSDSGREYWCMVSDQDGVTLMSDDALLVVEPKPVTPPKTGDPTPVALYLALLFGGLLGLLLLAKRTCHTRR